MKPEDEEVTNAKAMGIFIKGWLIVIGIISAFAIIMQLIENIN